MPPASMGSASPAYSMGASVGYRLAATCAGRVSALVAIGGVADDAGEPDDTAELVDLLEDGRHAGALRAIEAERGDRPPAVASA